MVALPLNIFSSIHSPRQLYSFSLVLFRSGALESNKQKGRGRLNIALFIYRNEKPAATAHITNENYGTAGSKIKKKKRTKRKKAKIPQFHRVHRVVVANMLNNAYKYVPFAHFIFL